ncbi:deoxyhypusine synthase [Candidatus Micrarchaeota archaeon]|nr:deoxyhypusine synthase [Candidatus Micrarchaeota archaeon]
MSKSSLLSNPVKEMKLRKGMTAREIVEQMKGAGGFGAKNLADGVEVLREMLGEKECVNFLSFPACIVATGMRGALAQVVKDFDVIITTCGTLDHDLARAWGGKYYEGSFELDDWKLHKQGVNRLGNVLVPNESYGEVLEKGMEPVLKELVRVKEEWGGRELIHEFGKRVKDEDSILFQAAKHNVPIYVPGITDGAFGTNLALFAQDKKFKLNVLKDEKELSDVVFDSKKTGALMVGGGISKHHVIWWNQFKGGLDYAVYVTTASQYDGSLSGARLKEAVSWGKVKEKARMVTVDGDATILLPLMFAAL